jgi:hypothetical protein
MLYTEKLHLVLEACVTLDRMSQYFGLLPLDSVLFPWLLTQYVPTVNIILYMNIFPAGDASLLKDIFISK